MNTQVIDGKCYARMLLGGAAALAQHTSELNAMNVFPVSDGDTGTNMLKTMEGGLAEVKEDVNSIGKLSGFFSKGVLLAARGNSGVILSQIFAGINEGLSGCDEASAQELAEAYRRGIEKSYASVQNPTEGTILTVFRESTEYASSCLDESSTPEDFFRIHIEQAKKSLEATKEILPVLAEADVVDSGAAGYLYLAEGMYEALSGKTVAYEISREKEAANTPDIDSFTRDSVLEFGYCTEFLIRLTTNKVDPDSFEIKTVLDVLEELNGESVVAYKQDDIVKVHVHTFSPGEIMLKMQEFGEFLTVKVENMSLGHSDTEKKKPERKKGFSVVAVSTGEGLSALFTHMGAHRIVSGGQTANPSIEDFVKAFEKCDTEDIIVLPNNKNVILAAKQAAELYKAAGVHVIETANLMQGYGALSVINPGIKDMDTVIKSASHAAADIIDGEITRAVRDASVDGVKINCGDYMAFAGGKLSATAETAEEAVIQLLENADTDLCDIINLFVGKNVSENDRVALTEKLKELYEDCEITVYEGGQEVYDYLVAVE